MDGYRAGFYQANWSIISQDVVAFVKDMWRSPEKIASINITGICFIPKIDKPKFVSQFRPISLCNVSYKLLTKIVVNRLKPQIANIVSHCQTGFIPDRSIH